jgi:hypothetical protein
MSILCQTAAPANSGPAYHPYIMALRHMGLDAVGLFRTAPGGYKHILVAVDNVTEPLKLIPYYCLNHSSWPLSNNIEVTCRLCRVTPCKSLTSLDRHLYNKLTRR